MPGGFHGCEVPDVLEVKGVVCMLGLDMLGLYIRESRTACGNGNLADKEVGVALASITFGLMKVSPLGMHILQHMTINGIGGQFSCEEGLVAIGLAFI